MYVYDNSIDDVFPKLLFRSTSGKIEKTYTDINPWAESIFLTLQT